MTKPRIHRHVVRNREKSSVPLSKLRTSDAVKTVVNHPRRLEELLRMLEDKDRGVRGRAAATLARLAEYHPARLMRAILRLRVGFCDDSAYVRWHIAYTFGTLGSHFPSQSRTFLNDLVSRLDDENRVVRTISCKAIGQMAARKPGTVEAFFQDLKREIPPPVARVLRASKLRQPK